MLLRVQKNPPALLCRHLRSLPTEYQVRVLCRNERRATKRRLEVVVVVLGKRLCSGSLEFLLVLVLEVLVELELWRLQGRGLDEGQGIVSGKLSGKPQERLFEVVVGLCRNIVVLQVLLAVESDLLGLDLTILDFYFVSTQDNRDVLANSSQVTMPVRNILVSDTRSDIEHDNGALALNVVSVTKSSKFFLSGGIPNIEFDWTTVGVKSQGMHLYPQSRNIFLLEFSRQVTLNESGLTNTTVTDEDKFEFWCTCESHFELLLF
mmetsp:Transcript_6604/g.13646  ORF Transcript_6604/g.13646 Transcript_6604/m.13646 type:complete len:263 (+) Transcript_6604:210-998(+)